MSMSSMESVRVMESEGACGQHGECVRVSVSIVAGLRPRWSRGSGISLSEIGGRVWWKKLICREEIGV